MQERVRAIRQVPSIAFNILEGVMDIKKRGLFHYFLADPLDPELTSPSPLGLYQIDTDNRRQSISVSRCIDILAYCSREHPHFVRFGNGKDHSSQRYVRTPCSAKSGAPLTVHA